MSEPDSGTHHDRGRRWVAALTAAIVLAPYATIGVAFRTALIAQAAAILALVSMPLLVRVVPRRGRPAESWDGWRSSPGPVLGAALYAAAALVGGLVGVLRGNSLFLLCGQLLSMGLLPLAWWVGRSTFPPTALAPGVMTITPSARILLAPRTALAATARGLVAAVALASGAHLVHWLAEAMRGDWVRRLAFAGSVSVTGTALLAILFALALAATGSRRSSRLWLGSCWIAVLFTLGSGARGLWVATGLAALMTLTLDRSWGAIARRRLAPGVALILVLLLAVSAFELRSERTQEELLEKTGVFEPSEPRPPGLTFDLASPSGAPFATWRRVDRTKRWPLTRIEPMARAGTYRLAAEVSGAAAERGWVGVQWLDRSGNSLAFTWSPVVEGGAWRTVEVLASPPPATVSWRLVAQCSDRSEGTWRLRRASFKRVAPSGLGPLLSQVRYSRWRILSLLRPDPAADASMSYRVRESTALLGRLRHASMAALLWGHGLGATFAADGDPRRAPGAPPPPEVNYIHNFYLFLLFKLGLAGSALALGALAAWTWHLFAALRGAAPGLEHRLVAATTAGWLAYCVWSVSSAALLDFRIAPLWGLLLAALPRPGSPTADHAPREVPQSVS